MRPTVHDLANLIVMTGAKLGAKRYGSASDRSFYDEHFSDRHIELFERDIRARLRREEVLKALEGLVAGSVVVDLGCGIGHMIRAVESDCQRIGIDLSTHSLRLAQRTDPTVWFACASAYELPLYNRSVDAVICLEVVEHLADDRRALREVARVLKPGGRLILSVPHSYYFRSYLRLMGHYRHYRRTQLDALLESLGFVVSVPLNEYKALNGTYLYLYAPLRLLSVFLSAVTRRPKSVYSMRLPGVRRPIYQQLDPIFEHFIRRDLSVGPDVGSTFLVAQRSMHDSPAS